MSDGLEISILRSGHVPGVEAATVGRGGRQDWQGGAVYSHTTRFSLSAPRLNWGMCELFIGGQAVKQTSYGGFNCGDVNRRP